MPYPRGPRRRSLQGLIALCAFALLAGAWPAQAQDRVRRALILYPENNVNRQGLLVGEAFRKQLMQIAPDIETFSDFLDLSRFPDEVHRQRMVRYLADKYAQAAPDVVFAVGPDVLRLLAANRRTLMPKTPVLFCCSLPETVTAVGKPDYIAGIVSEVDVAKTVALAAGLQPRARRLVLVAGGSPFERRWSDIGRRQIAGLASRYEIRPLIGLPRADLLREMARLPRDTIVVVLALISDGSGRNLPTEFMEELSRVSAAPIYSPYPVYLGRGVVGGHIDDLEGVGVNVADMAREVIVGGKAASAVGIHTSTSITYMVDARQLERWRLPEKQLPKGTVVQFKEPSLWQRHHQVVIITAAAFLLQTIVLAALLMQTMRRRQAERSLRVAEERAATLQEEERQRIAQDLHDSTAQHLAAIGLNMMMLKGDNTTEADKQRALEDMKASLQEATRELRTFTYLLHPPGLQRDGLAGTLQRYVEEFGRRTGLETSVELDQGLNDLPLPLQRSILRIVQEALANVHRHAAATRVSIALRREERKLHLLISDDGRGIAEGGSEGARLGIGIQGIKARVKQFGGDVVIRSKGDGTTVHAVVPA